MRTKAQKAAKDATLLCHHRWSEGTEVRRLPDGQLRLACDLCGAERWFLELPSNEAWREAWAAFAQLVMGRLEMGSRRTGDRNLRLRPLYQLLAEIAEELADVAGWSSLAHARIVRMQEPARLAELMVRDAQEVIDKPNESTQEPPCPGPCEQESEL